MSKEKDFKIGLYELFNSGGTNGGLFIDGDDAEMLHDEIILLFKKLNIEDVETCLEFIPSTQEGLFCAVCNEHKEYHSK